MSPVVLLGLAGLIVLVGAIVQGAAGLGMNLLAAPLLVLLDPVLVPVPLLVASFLLSVMAVRRELPHVDWRGGMLAVAGRAPGTAIGVFAVALPPRQFAVAVGTFVLLCALVSAVSWRPKRSAPLLFGAGFVGGITGTSSSIGVPPVALLYQHEEGPRIRATLAIYIVFGTVISLVGLAIGGQIGWPEINGSLVLLPFMAVGFALSGPLRRYLDTGWMRASVLTLSAGSAAFLIIRGLLP